MEEAEARAFMDAQEKLLQASGLCGAEIPDSDIGIANSGAGMWCLRLAEHEGRCNRAGEKSPVAGASR